MMSAPATRRVRRVRNVRRLVAGGAVALLLGAPLACAPAATETTAGPTRTDAPATGPSGTDGTTPGTTGTEVPSTTTTEPPTTSTTAAVTTTAAPTTAPPPPTTRPTSALPVATRPRPAPPKAGRPAPPEPIPLPGPAVVANEGDWQPAGPDVDGAPALYTTTLRTNASGSSTAGIAWIDTTAVRGELFPGANEPGGQWSVPFNVPLDQKPSLVAAFNSGFLLNEAQGGFYLEGRQAVPLRPGTAALHIDTNGTMTVGALGRDFDVGPDTAAIRQNLPLLVDGGAVAASATDRDAYVWGKTLGGGAFVWRSGIGVRGDGTLVYVAGPAMSARMLGSTLVAAGAVRAMELDINPNWVTFNIFSCTAQGDCSGRKLVPGMLRDPNRYLTPETRDFFALFART